MNAEERWSGAKRGPVVAFDSTGQTVILAPKARRGIYRIADSHLVADRNAEEIRAVLKLAQMRVLDFWHDMANREHVYLGESPLFDELKPGDPVPLYVLRATRDNGELVSVTAERASVGVLAQKL